MLNNKAFKDYPIKVTKFPKSLGNYLYNNKIYKGNIIMAKKYIYKNKNTRPVNIGGYQFAENQELKSDILLSGFNEAVCNRFLELTECKFDGVESDATQAQQTGNTGKVKVIFHMGVDAMGGEIIKEIEIDPGVIVDFPNVDSRDDEIFDAWFKDAEFTKIVNVGRAKSSKKGELHFYGKFFPKPEDPHKSLDVNDEESSVEDKDKPASMISEDK
jgi:hypothetical protein